MLSKKRGEEREEKDKIYRVTVEDVNKLKPRSILVGSLADAVESEGGRNFARESFSPTHRYVQLHKATVVLGGYRAGV